MGTLRQLKSYMKKDEELRKLLVRSGRGEILIDLDGDKVPDIGLLDVNRTGDINAIAVDLTGNGEFNFYMVDHDGNGIPDEISFYRDGDDIPVNSVFGRSVEARIVKSVVRIHALMTAEELSSGDFLDSLSELLAYVAGEYDKLVEDETGDDEEEAEEEEEEADEGGDSKE